MQRIIEVVRVEEARYAVHRLVVDEDRAEQRLLRLEVVGSLTEGQRIVGSAEGSEPIGDLERVFCHGSRYPIQSVRRRAPVWSRPHYAHGDGISFAALRIARRYSSLACSSPSAGEAPSSNISGLNVSSSSFSSLTMVTSSPRDWRSASSSDRATFSDTVTTTSGCRATRTGCRPRFLIGRSRITWRRSMVKPPAVTTSAMSRVATEP